MYSSTIGRLAACGYPPPGVWPLIPYTRIQSMHPTLFSSSFSPAACSDCWIVGFHLCPPFKQRILFLISELVWDFCQASIHHLVRSS